MARFAKINSVVDNEMARMDALEAAGVDIVEENRLVCEEWKKTASYKTMMARKAARFHRMTATEEATRQATGEAASLLAVGQTVKVVRQPFTAYGPIEEIANGRVRMTELRRGISLWFLADRVVAA